MSELRKPNSVRNYTKAHPSIPPGLGIWRGRCGRCNAEVMSGKKHPIFGLVCKAGCQR